MTSRCIGRKTEARGGNGEIPAAALGDGMMGGGTPDLWFWWWCVGDFDADDFDDNDDDIDLEQPLSGVCADEQRTGKAALLMKLYPMMVLIFMVMTMMTILIDVGA